MIDKVVAVGIVVFCGVVLSYSDFGNQPKVYDCTENLNKYPADIQIECRQLIEEFRRQQEKKDSKIYI